MKRSHKVLVAAGVIVLSLSLTILAGEPPEPYLTVEQAREETTSDQVQVAAIVVPGSVRQDADGMTRFVVRGESNVTMNATYDEGLPQAFGGDKWVTVTGTVETRDGVDVLVAEDVQIGCPSKWDAKRDTSETT